ncbi:MAG: hypothetical protein ACYC8T_35645, partial [Myxococcaceae bacterium]
MRSWLLAAMIIASTARASPQADLKAAIQLYDDFRPEDAARALRPLTEGGVPATVRARAWLYLGLAQGTLVDESGARGAFREAFLLDPSLPLPESAPEVRALADAERAAVRADLEGRAAAAAKAKEDAKEARQAEAKARAEAAARAREEAAARAREAAEAKARAEAEARADVARLDRAAT